MNNRVKKQLQEFFVYIDEIPDSKKYWLIRTDGGEYFESFTDHNYIGLGYDKIAHSTINDLKKTSKNQNEFKNKLKLHVENIYPDKVPGFVAGQLTRFVYEIKKGDVVIVPSEGSSYISIGEVQETQMIEVDEKMINRTKSPFRKRKKIKWYKTIPKRGIDVMLFKALKSHQTVTNISEYANIIERSLKDFYKIDDTTNFILNVKKEEDIPAPDLLFFGSDLLKITRDFISDHNLDVDINDIDLK